MTGDNFLERNNKPIGSVRRLYCIGFVEAGRDPPIDRNASAIENATNRINGSALEDTAGKTNVLKQ